MKLTILNSQNSKPVAIFEDGVDGGIRQTSGDPSVVQHLGLNRFHTLQDIAQYVNSDGGSSLQAILDEKETEEPEENRLDPALKIVKDLLERVKNRKEKGADPVPEAKEENPADASPPASAGTVVEEKPYMIYVSYDGDGIGNAVARAEEKDDEQELAQMSQKINNGQKAASDWCMRFNGVIIEQGGDEGLVKVPSTAIHHLEELREAYLNEVGATLTVGVGQKISESTKARMLGKLKGKNQVLVYDDQTPKELELLMQDQDKSEANKIQTALNGGGNFQAAGGFDPAAQEQKAAPSSEAPEPQVSDEMPPVPPAEEETQDIALQNSFPKWAAPQEQPAPEEQPEVSDQPSASDKPKPPFSQQMIDAMEPDKKKTKSVYRNPYNDPEIEAMDFSGADDPDFAKSFQYTVRYGADNK